MAALRPKITRLTGVLATGMALSLALAGCAGNSSDGGGGTGGNASSIKIGFMGDLTGENSGIVIPPLNGAILAFEEYNAKNPKVKIDFNKDLHYDSQGKSDIAPNLVTKAISQDKVTGLIGPAFSGESKSVGKQLDENKIPSVSPSATNPGLAQNGWKYWHRVVANDNDQGPGIADFMMRAKSPKKVLVVSDDQEYSIGLAEALAKAFKDKGTTVETDKFSKDSPNYNPTANKATAFQPDLIAFGGYYAQGGKLLKQLRDAGVKAPFVTGDGSLDAGLVSGAGAQNAEGAVIGCPCKIPFGSVTGPLKDFKDKYKARFNTDPQIYAAEGYDAATAFIKAVEAGKTSGDDINEFLKTLSFEGVSKPIKFKDNGEPQANSIFVYQVKAGQIGLLGDSTQAKLEG
ncbi:amino acid/amide ABC transporter substrate-binding protein (HAAT family) [Herbihabitans rhizosphaerae]|uniref:Amino acid/amide ABC transporter substrate-binding protein (HAAT family) n=1 Tax=Herbihabitans rhizosphaerae TaxID=1872711 RepID=A0A4Q7KIA1_9PSEU|nr:branched-chain amino acid ABC transporter substrate-binding protein [Herbihabitans rhizosphaerae]RZS34909.1 amino acid/amide ABC transporter substrate-binding protein (HAAT family) [Herbihabitans rhizosphaerae]